MAKGLVDAKALDRVREAMESFVDKREQLIGESRRGLQASKKAIFALHRGDKKEARGLLDQAEKIISHTNKDATKEVLLSEVGIFRACREEYAEAVLFEACVLDQPLPTLEELDLDIEAYLGGLSDLTGELGRYAINSAIADKPKESKRATDFVSELYEELLKFSFRGNLRRKFDSIKYNLQKMEDLMLSLKLKDIL